MLVTLIGKESLSKVVLPQKIAGNYWIYNKEENKKIINIESIDNNWQIRSTDYCKIIKEKNIVNNTNFVSVLKDGNEIIDKVILKEYSFYYVTLGYNSNVYILYCSPLVEENFFHLQVKDTVSILIGRDKRKNHIAYNLPFVNERQAKIFFFNGMWQIENYDRRFNTFVNNKPIYNTVKILSNGDRIYIYGLTLILIGKELFINNPCDEVSYNKNYFSLSTYSNELIKKDDEDELIYENKNYFLRSPRMLEVIEDEKIKIASLNISRKNRELPMALVLASTLSMGLITVVSLVQTINNIMSGKVEASSAIFSILISVTMLFATVLIPVINNRYSARMKKRGEKEDLENYKKYINKKKQFIEESLNRTRSKLFKTYVSVEECVNIIYDKSRIWERTISDSDFLTVRLGIGDVPSNLILDYNKDDKFEENTEADNLLLECVEKAKTIKNGPMLLSLLDKNISAILYKDEETKQKFIQNLLLQLVTFQSYDELKLVFLLKDNADGKWNFVKTLPHVWTNSRELRFFADKPDDINVISQHLENELRKRNQKEGSKTNYADHLPYYLIIIDDYQNVDDLNSIDTILKNENNLGFSILFLADSITKLPNECKTFVNIQEHKGTLFESENADDTKMDFTLDTSEIISFTKINQILFDIHIKYKEDEESSLPNLCTFLEMYQVGNIKQLNILDRWKKSDSTISLSAPIGIDKSGNIINLDVHEKYDGPHGLIAGSTGSGKSEFIITYILSLAINYHPDDVTFVLIDYKGGGLAGAFEKPNVKLPHLVGTITNIDKTNLQRSLEAIKSELHRRQVVFNEARIITNESTIDIYKYQKYYHKGVLKKPISHLFIISDEFAELKQQEPDFMDELISVARIGRSLGIHLILATQKPAGVVNDQIRSNAKFGICLQVQTPSDSKDIINTADAAKLTGSGQFYLKVGNDDYLTLGQSAWTGALYNPSNEVEKKYDTYVEFVSDIGKTLKKEDDINNKKNTKDNKGDQVTNIVKYLCNIAEEENIHKENLWLSPIPENIYIDAIRKKYKVKVQEDIIEPVIGEYDDPSRQLQNYLSLNFSKTGNIIVYGNAESGKETLISTMVYDIIYNYSSEMVQMYLLDFGGESMKIFKEAPHVGDVLFIKDFEKINRFFVMMQNELKKRKEVLSNYNGDYDLFVKKNNTVIPMWIIVLNNYESFRETYLDKYDETLETLLREGLKYRIIFVFTVNTVNGLRYRTIQCFRQKIALQMNKEDDYANIFDHLGKKRPTNVFGRGLIALEEKNYYEFQTAKICKAEIWNEKIMEVIEEQKKKQTVKAKQIDTIPNIVTINDVVPVLKGISAFPIGVSYKTLKPCNIDLKKNLLNLMITHDLERCNNFIVNIIEMMKLIPDAEYEIFDGEDMLENKEENIKDKYIKIFEKLNKATTIKKDVVFVIIGLDRFISELGSEDLFFESIKNAQELEKCHYIIIDIAKKISNHIASKWYEKFANSDTGVWIGNGINEQYILKSHSSSKNLINNCGDSFGYIFKKGVPTFLKLLGIKETMEENKENE